MNPRRRRSIALLALLFGMALVGCSGAPSTQIPSGTLSASAPTVATAAPATPAPSPSPSGPSGFTSYGGSGQGFSLGLPLGWRSATPGAGKLFEAKSPTEGSLFVLLDDRPVAQDFNTWLDDHLATGKQISGTKPTIEHVTIAGGAAIRDTTNLFGFGVYAAYYLPVPGKGVLALSFQSLDPGEPPIWAEIAATFGAGQRP